MRLCQACSIQTLQSVIQLVTRFARFFPILFVSAAYSCPLCHTQTGEQVRAGIFNRSFGLNLLAIGLPFPVFAGVIVWLYFGKPGPRSKNPIPRRESETSPEEAEERVSVEEQK
jgi:hypothetical protein